MNQWIKSLMEAAQKYTIWDFALFKTCLITIGILMGVYFADFFRTYLSVIWVAAIIAYIWIMYKTFIVYRK